MKCDECENFNPKKKQTGAMCRQCSTQRCVTSAPEPFRYSPNRCPYKDSRKTAKWEPYYGEVVRE